MAKRPYRIAGGGLSGLSAAITLAAAGWPVELYEKGPSCGARRQADFEGLETWIFDDDPLDYLVRRGLPTSFATRPVVNFHYIDPAGALHLAEAQRPFFYLVQRGAEAGCIDRVFQDRALEAGVQIHFGQSRQPGEVDIYAGGPQRAGAYVQGITFSTTAADGVYLVLGQATARAGYAYGIIWNGAGTLATAFKSGRDKEPPAMDILTDQFEKATGAGLSGVRSFASFGNYARRPELYRDGALLAGEAAGWQDALFGFGMNFAVRSGVLAARALAEKGNYSALCRVELTGKMSASWASRRLYEKLGDRAMARIAGGLIRRQVVWQALHAAAQPSLLKRLRSFWRLA